MHATFHRVYISWHGSRYSIRRYYRRFIRRRHRWEIVPPLKRPFAEGEGVGILFIPRWFRRLLCSRPSLAGEFERETINNYSCYVNEQAGRGVCGHTRVSLSIKLIRRYKL